MMMNSSELVELDTNELENLLAIEDHSIDYEKIDPLQVIPEEYLNLPIQSTSTVSTPNLRSSEDANQNLVLIKVPEPDQHAIVFESFPSIPLETNVVAKLNEASASSDGLFLPLSAVQFYEENPVKVEILRRPPLQTIRHINIQVEESPKLPQLNVARSLKRKQHFKFTREDGIVFTAELTDIQQVKRAKVQILPEPEPLPVVQVATLKDNFESWDTTDGEETDIATESEKQVKEQCPGCHKLFKKIANHKCKAKPRNVCTPCDIEFDDNLAVKEHEEAHNSMICNLCRKTYKSKKGLVTHLKKCFQLSKVAIKIEKIQTRSKKMI